MNFDLTKQEIEIIDAALVEWQNAPASNGLVASIFSTLTGRHKKESPEAIRASAIKDVEDAQARVRVRELQAMRLRLKLREVSERAGEFETPPPQ